MANVSVFHLNDSLCLASTLQQFQSGVSPFWLWEKEFFALISWSRFINRTYMNSGREGSTIRGSLKGRCHRIEISVWTIHV